MAYSYGRIDKLNTSLQRHGVDKGVIAAIMSGGELITPRNTNEAKAGWFSTAMRRMDELMDEKTKHRVREDCACCLGGERLKIVKGIFKENDTLAKRVAAANASQKVFGNSVTPREDGSFEVSFSKEDDQKKSCPCLPGAKEAMPITYCYCCGGHVKHHLQIALGKNLSVEVLSSALSSQGELGCRFRLREVD